MTGTAVLLPVPGGSGALMTVAILATSAVLLAVALGAVLAPRWATLRFGIGGDHAGPPKGLDFDKLTPDERRRVLDG
jgi:hypothetical protein